MTEDAELIARLDAAVIARQGLGTNAAMFRDAAAALERAGKELAVWKQRAEVVATARNEFYNQIGVLDHHLTEQTATLEAVKAWKSGTLWAQPDWASLDDILYHSAHTTEAD